MVRFGSLLPAAVDTSFSGNEDLSQIMQKLDDIDNEIAVTHNFICQNYQLKFPELETLVKNPIDYARIVKRIGNEQSIVLVDLVGLLSLPMITVVSIVASASNDKPLPEVVLDKTISACDRALVLDSEKKKLLDFLENRMGSVAPNLSAIVGHAVAAKLIAAAGGLSALTSMPACNVQLLGAHKESLAGFSKSKLHIGFLDQAEIFQTTPPSLRMRTCRLLAAKSTLAARIDSNRGDCSGSAGRALREGIRKKIEKWQELPAAAATKKPMILSVHESNPKKKRGGRRLRKTKEKYGETRLRKLANRMLFGVPEVNSLGF